jgi:hypothetical protein
MRMLKLVVRKSECKNIIHIYCGMYYLNCTLIINYMECPKCYVSIFRKKNRFKVDIPMIVNSCYSSIHTAYSSILQALKKCKSCVDNERRFLNPNHVISTKPCGNNSMNLYSIIFYMSLQQLVSNFWLKLMFIQP